MALSFVEHNVGTSLVHTMEVNGENVLSDCKNEQKHHRMTIHD